VEASVRPVKSSWSVNSLTTGRTTATSEGFSAGSSADEAIQPVSSKQQNSQAQRLREIISGLLSSG